MKKLALLLTTAALIGAAPPARAQLRTVEAQGMRIVYWEGADASLVPHAARSALHSLAFQKELFGFEPDGEVSVLLHDLSDIGNGGTSTVPYDGVRVQIAPLSLAFETLAGSDRIAMLMNHELVHLAAMDQAAPRDRLFRRLFGGKVVPVAEQPESILYFFLTSPRVAAPRWYQEGIAVFLDTWMAGGLGRAQSGYDEMVFRAMVRDGTPFHDPLGLVSEGTRADFQLQMNSYLYGTRFMTWLARRHSPEKLLEWVARRDGSRAYYASQFERVFGQPLGRAWQAWVEDEQAFQRANLAAIREHAVTPHRDLTSRALGSVSRAYYDPSAGKLYAAFNYPGVVAHLGAIDVASGATERLADVKGPLIYTVTSLAFDPATRTLFYTTDNAARRDLVSFDLATRRATLALGGTVVGERLLPRLWGTFDQGFALPLPHPSLWLHQAAGYSPRRRDEPFANFYFGGFGNNYLDHLAERRYRELPSFPGIGLNQIGGRNFVKSTLAWTLPPWRFRRAGTPGFHAAWARPALFATGLVTNLDAPSARRAPLDVGLQVDVQLSLLSALDLTLSLGGALAFEEGRPPGREAMISLKVLR